MNMASDDAGRDRDIGETHATDALTAFEDALPGGGPPRVGWLRAYGPAVAAFALVIALWEAVTVVFNVQSFLLPRPSLIAERFVATADVIWLYGWHTLIEALGGLVAGTTLGVLAALATTRWAAVREGLMPFAIAANSVPIIALAPITNSWFSLSSPVSKMAVAAVVVFFPVMINTARGLIEVDPQEVELLASYAASPRQIMRRVRVPHALPYFFSAVKVASALCLIAAIVAEYFGGPDDVLGRYILRQASLLVLPDAWAAILVASIMGIGLYGAVLLVERLAMPWHPSQRAGDVG
jgi:NitT/TauT family transport system permease protein